MNVLVIHGPNLNLLGRRDPEVYGTATLAEINDRIRETAGELGMEVDIQQLTGEGEIVAALHSAIGRADAALVNPGAYAHTSRAIADAFRSVPYPVIEVHLSNIHAREEWRRTTVTGEAAAGLICGFKGFSYLLGLYAAARQV